MSENAEKHWSVFPRSQYDVLKCLVCPQLKHIQFTAIEEERDLNVFTFFKLDLENIVVFLKKKKTINR